MMWVSPLYGAYHRISPEHFQPCLNELARRHNTRDCDTFDQMNAVVTGLIGRRLPYREVTA